MYKKSKKIVEKFLSIYTYNYNDTEFIFLSLLEMIDRSADIVDLGGRPGSAIIRESIALFVDKVREIA